MPTYFHAKRGNQIYADSTEFCRAETTKIVIHYNTYTGFDVSHHPSRQHHQRKPVGNEIRRAHNTLQICRRIRLKVKGRKSPPRCLHAPPSTRAGKNKSLSDTPTCPLFLLLLSQWRLAGLSPPPPDRTSTHSRTAAAWKTQRTCFSTEGWMRNRGVVSAQDRYAIFTPPCDWAG